MKKYIFYNKILVAAIENGEIVLDPNGIENSEMPSSWKSKVKWLLLNALPEGFRYSDSIRCIAHRDSYDYKWGGVIGLINYVDELPGHFAVRDTPVFCDEPVRRYAPLPDALPPVLQRGGAQEVQSRLSPDLFDWQSDARRNMKQSFSGYQDSFVAKLSTEEGRLILSSPSPAERGNAVVKVSNHFSYPFIAENEYACMKLAESLGFNVPRVFLFYQPDLKQPRFHFVIERFDYAAGKDAEPQKLEICEMAALMGLEAENKYSAGSEEFFEFAQNFLDTTEIKKLARMYFFGILICNGNMHAKNFSILFNKDEKPCLAPMYDMLNTQMYERRILQNVLNRHTVRMKELRDSDSLNMLALPMGKARDSNPSLGGVIKFLESYIDKDEMYQMARGVRENLSAALNSAFQNTKDKSDWDRHMERGILNRVSRVKEAIKNPFFFAKTLVQDYEKGTLLQAEGPLGSLVFSAPCEEVAFPEGTEEEKILWLETNFAANGRKVVEAKEKSITTGTLLALFGEPPVFALQEEMGKLVIHNLRWLDAKGIARFKAKVGKDVTISRWERWIKIQKEKHKKKLLIHEEWYGAILRPPHPINGLIFVAPKGTRPQAAWLAKFITADMEVVPASCPSYITGVVRFLIGTPPIFAIQEEKGTGKLILQNLIFLNTAEIDQVVQMAGKGKEVTIARDAELAWWVTLTIDPENLAELMKPVHDLAEKLLKTPKGRASSEQALREAIEDDDIEFTAEMISMTYDRGPSKMGGALSYFFLLYEYTKYVRGKCQELTDKYEISKLLQYVQEGEEELRSWAGRKDFWEELLAEASETDEQRTGAGGAF